MGKSQFNTITDIVANCVSSPTGCYIWTGIVNDRGYGVIAKETTRGRRRVGAHRLLKEMQLGRSLSREEFVMHKCDTPVCCRPEHLVLGDALDNMVDMHQKGRANPPRGTRCGFAKLTPELVLKIRARHSEGVRNVVIAKEFAMSQSAISAILRGDQWTHIV